MLKVREGFGWACRWVLGAAALLLATGGWAQPGKDWPPGTAGKDYNVVDAQGKRQGVWIRVWPKGNLYYRGAFQDGYPVGTFEFYYESGKLMTRLTHSERGTRMVAQHYRENGKLRAEGNYIESSKRDEAGDPIREKDGLWRYYDEAEKLRMEETYAAGLLHGPTRSLTASGRVIEEGAYREGERHGVWKTYSELGVLRSEIGYENGLFHGKCTMHYPDGKPMSMGLYARGLETGAWKTFTADGQVETTRRFEDGVLLSEVRENGSFMDYYEDERPKSEYNYRGGKLEGAFREWHDVGEWEVEEVPDAQGGDTYARRVMRGVQVAREGTYAGGVLHGPVYTYDTTGRRIKTEHYEQGTCRRTETH